MGTVKRSHLQDNPAVVNDWKKGQLKGPLCVEVGLTNICNHECVHCDVIQFQEIEKRVYMPIDPLLTFMQDFRQMGGVEIYYAESGEPFLHREFEQILAHGSELGIRQCASTNGIFLTEKIIESSLHKFTWIRFSINGGSAETYARIHQCRPVDFETLKNNLKLANEYRRKMKIEIGLEIQYLIVEETVSDLRDIVSFHQETGMDKLIIKCPVWDDREIKLSPDFLNELEEIDKLENVSVRWDKHMRPNLIDDQWNQCNGIYFRTNLSPEGNLWTCYKHYSEGPSLIYGNIFDQRFTDIWQSEKRKNIFFEVASGKLKDRICLQGCQCSRDNIQLDNEDIK